MKMKNRDYARILYATSMLVEIDGGNKFRASAFARAARAIERYPEDINDVIAEGRAATLEGIGKSLAKELQVIQQSGTMDAYEALKAKLPTTILQLTTVQGLGPKKVRQLYVERGIDSLDALQDALKEGTLKGLRGFGPKTVANLQGELERLAANSGRIPLPRALEMAAPILDYLRALPETSRAELAGSARRGRDLVKDLDFVVASNSPSRVSEAFVSMPGV